MYKEIRMKTIRLELREETVKSSIKTLSDILTSRGQNGEVSAGYYSSEFGWTPMDVALALVEKIKDASCKVTYNVTIEVPEWAIIGLVSEELLLVRTVRNLHERRAKATEQLSFAEHAIRKWNYGMSTVTVDMKFGLVLTVPCALR
jgi:hypothetical protein